MKKATKMESKHENNLESFLAAFAQLPQQVVDGMLLQSADEDQKTVIKAFGDVLIEQVTELSSYLRSTSSKISAQARIEVDTFLRLSAVNTLLRSARTVATNLASSSAKMSISGIFQEIKKIIEALLGIFGITLPKWVDALLVLIDEIVDWLLSGGSTHLAAALSRAHQNYLGELVQLARLEREHSWRYAPVGEDENL